MNVKTVFPAVVCVQLLGWIIAAAAPAQITSIVRAVSASADDIDCASDSDSITSSTFGMFTGTVDAEASAGPFCDVSASSGQAAQTSTATSQQIVAMGSSSSDGSLSASSSANSSITATLALSSPSSYMISGTLSGRIDDFFLNDTSPGSAKIRLTQGANTVFELTQTTLAPESFSMTGLLSAETYVLEATAPTSAIQNIQETAAFDFTFTVPEPSCGCLAFLACPCLGQMLRRRRHRSR